MKTGKRPQGTISLSEAARRLGLQHHKDVHLLHQHGEIRAWRIGSMWCIDARSVEDYLQQKEQLSSWRNHFTGMRKMLDTSQRKQQKLSD